MKPTDGQDASPAGGTPARQVGHQPGLIILCSDGPMTLFGKSLFETVLAGIDARKQDEEEDSDPTEPAIRGLNAGFVGRNFHGDHVAEADPTAQFETFLPDWETLVVVAEDEIAANLSPEPVKPIWLERLTEVEIAEDIGIDRTMTKEQLQERRRQFARDNHPDRVLPEYQPIANLRMMVANQLIDRALKSART